MITASTFGDFVEDYGIGTQHHLMPTGRWIGTDAGHITSPAPGDDQPPRVLATWPGHEQSVCSLRAGTVKIHFSEQVWINQTNVLVNNGAVVPTGTSYDSRDASFHLAFDPPLRVGTYVVQVRPAVTDLVGNQLDGNGDGVGGDVYPFRFYVRAELLVGAGADYPTIQEAIDAAGDGDVIVVQPGSYPEQISFLGKAVTARSTDPTDPATVASTVIDASSLSGGPVVSFVEGEGPESILEGLTITGSNSWLDGGGINIEQASPTVRFCRIQANQAASGGGIFCFQGSPTIQACLIRHNIADYGAGIYSINSLATIVSNVLAENHAYVEGSAIYSGGFGDDLILNNTIVGNTADGGGLGGAAVLVLVQAQTGLFSNLFWQNSDFDLVVFDADPAVACNLFAAIPPGYEGYGNLAADPLLTNWPAGDYHIGYDSPCFNGGSPWFGPPRQISDMDGQPRAAVGRVDIGADEIAQAQSFIVDWQGSGDFTTIQAAIDAAPGQQEIIQVLPGTYPETINFRGKAITVTSIDPNDPAVVAATIIDGGSGGAVVTFNSGEDRRSILSGFTITHSQPVDAPGIFCDIASPTITHNRITANGGSGIYVWSRWPLISYNEISANTASQGAGIYLDGGSVELIANRIEGNQASSEGGGIYAYRGSSHQLVGNVISGNTATQRGGGLYLYNCTKVTMTGNLVVANTANDAGAIDATGSDFGGYASNNTFAYNTGQYALVGVPFHRNAILFNPAAGAECGSPVVRYCLVRGWTGGRTSFDADPQFVDPANGDYHLAATSACINAGDPTDPLASPFGPGDIDGDPRVVYGRIDVGADEYAGPFVPRLIDADPPADGTLPKTANNVIRLIFNGSVVLPAGPALSITPLAGGDDLGGSFACQLQTTTVADDTLKAAEAGSVLSNQTWYRISPAAGLDVQPFSLDFCTLFGDADGDGQVTAIDYFPVKNHMFELTDARYDLDGDGEVLALDCFVVKSHLFEAAPPQP